MQRCASALATAFADHALTASPKDSWQQQVEVKRAPVSARRVATD